MNTLIEILYGIFLVVTRTDFLVWLQVPPMDGAGPRGAPAGAFLETDENVVEKEKKKEVEEEKDEHRPVVLFNACIF